MEELLWKAMEREVIPDTVIRLGIREICRERLRDESRGGPDAQLERKLQFLAARRGGEIARDMAAANAQHYEVPTAFYKEVLGARLKYSGGYWPEGVRTLDASEDAMLELTCRRAEIVDGQRVLDLGCGWGALSLWIAEKFPRCTIVAVSNSRTQKEHILAEAARRGVKRIEVITCDMNRFAPPGGFDRVVSVEMFEHLWNHERLMSVIAGALAPGGKLFVHIFSHARFAYAYEDRGATDWMARTFFTGGSMLSDDALLYAQQDLRIEDHWRVDGTHYARTSEAWLENMDRRRAAIDPILASTYGAAHVARWRMNWRVFFLACAELFGYRGGREWMVSHYRFAKR
jgi:cyclopropane-fatty-acyl-phospholipid synthase